MIRVLVIHNRDNILTKNINKILKQKNYDVIELSNFNQNTINSLKHLYLNIVLLDIHYRYELGGLELSQLIKEKLKIPVVFICTYTSKEMFEIIKYFEPNGYVFTPLRENDLINTIEMAIEHHTKEHWISGILDSLAEGIIATDKKGTIRYINSLAKRYIGLKENNKAKSIKIGDVLKSVNLKTNNNVLKKDILCFSKNNITIEQKSLPLKGSDGNHEGWIFLFTDITEKSKTELELKESLDKLRGAMGGIIQAMALTVEIRDPYTAGHQRRVAQIARTIGNEMGLSEDQIDGLRMASVIHDMGKIHIPTEILTKPSKITELEFSLIKKHPEIAYEILKNIEFPWPVAEIVKQHHERMNGSGYPLGISGDDILIEARIIAVADVVEAMTSSRPYRPSLGWHVAINEILMNKDNIYDEQVVMAYINLVKSGEFMCP